MVAPGQPPTHEAAGSIDVTITSREVGHNVGGWQVHTDGSSSDHRLITSSYFMVFGYAGGSRSDWYRIRNMNADGINDALSRALSGARRSERQD